MTEPKKPAAARKPKAATLKAAAQSHVVPLDQEPAAGVFAGVTEADALQGGFPWAMSQAIQGEPVRRAIWTGNKTVNAGPGRDPQERIILTVEDLRATDWRRA